jgi:hypothetical protein
MIEEYKGQRLFGIYRIYWKSGGSSLASVGLNSDGTNWIAPINWLSPSVDKNTWNKVKSVKLLIRG